jgi:PhzF family phenazine biosynthesis protein
LVYQSETHPYHPVRSRHALQTRATLSCYSPWASAAQLQALKPDQAAIEAVSQELDLIGYYIFSTSTQQPGRDASARMFAQRFGITEEAGTGMVAGPLACYLHDVMGLQKTQFLIEQGHLMPTPSPSVIHVNLEIQDARIMA